MKKIVTLCSIVVLTYFTSCEEVAEIKSDSYSLDPISKVEWKGSMLEGFNTGTFDIESDNIIIKNDKIISGSFIIPIGSITNTNLPEGPVREQLLDHLKSSDFFNILLHPKASFEITTVIPYSSSENDALPGTNYIIEGNFTLLGKTNSISIPAKIEIGDNKIKTEAVFEIDRTKWGMNYAADSCLGEHYIKPKVELHLKAEGHLKL